MIQCSSMGASCTLEAAMAMPKPTSSTRPPGHTKSPVSLARRGLGSCLEEGAQGQEGTSGPEVWNTVALSWNGVASGQGPGRCGQRSLGMAWGVGAVRGSGPGL